MADTMAVTIGRARPVRASRSMLARTLFFGLLAVGGWCAWPDSGAAQAPGNVPARFRDLLDAGEFGPAQQLADRAADPAVRDRLLAALAQAQLGAGARNAAFDTLTSLADDRNRSQALSGMVPRPDGGAGGGGTLADFDTLIDLITATIAPQSWDVVGGPGAVDSFPGGVYVDGAGLLKRLPLKSGGRDLAVLRQRSLEDSGNRDYRQKARLRKISLTRLERELQLRWAFGKPPTEAMKALAGIRRLQYLFIYPETGDVVLAGPAGDWTVDAEGRRMSTDDRAPVLQLDDFVVVLRNARHQGGKFTCSITPRRENLAAAQAFLTESAKKAIQEEQRNAWLAQVRNRVGKQAIEIQGIEPRTRVARIIVEADYRMKLVGMGLEEGVYGVTSYLDSIDPNAQPPGMSVLRWWFTMNYDTLQATSDRHAYELKGQGVQVLSENEMLNSRGERIHTGTSDTLNEQFAHSFTKHFAALAAKYPIYAELRNVFDLGLVAALLVSEDIPGKVGWHLTHFDNPQGYQVELGTAPTEVETVINHRVLRRTQIVAGVSGGVSVDSGPFVRGSAIRTDTYGALQTEHVGNQPPALPRDAWWWD